VPRWLYQSSLFIDEMGGLDTFFPVGRTNEAICFSDVGSRTEPCVLAVNGPTDLHFGAAIDAYQQVARYRYSEDGDRIDNITDWALRLFEGKYGKHGVLDPKRATKGNTRVAAGRRLTKDSIFYYVYAVLYDPVYRSTYALNLQRELPRIPFYRDFWRWADWGKKLVQLHTKFSDVEPWPLHRIEKPRRKGSANNIAPKVVLVADRAKRVIRVDSQTELADVPAEIWDYRLGNRNAVEWILDQYKERKPKDPVVAKKFDAYRFEDYKEEVIEVIGRVVRVSVETVKITEEMKKAAR
jgi:predicted helicase